MYKDNSTFTILPPPRSEGRPQCSSFVSTSKTIIHKLF
jgi:hypothetical protein